MRTLNILIILILTSGIARAQAQQQTETQATDPPIYIAFLWHMHQPLYWPGQSIIQTQAAGVYPYSVFDIHNERTGPYTSWPGNAVQKGIDAGLPHAGASVSFSGSLIQNLNDLEDNGNGNFQNWTAPWKTAISQTTAEGNARMDMIGFGFYHPLMGLISYDDIRAQIQMHRSMLTTTFDTEYSKGIFPPENAFSPDMIPALADEGLEWALVDNIHFDRSAQNYPYNTAGNLYEPNKADVQNPDPNDWVQLNNLWAPTKISAQWGHQPHYVEYTDPETGESARIIAVPTSRYLGNEDGRGGFGALQYESVMSQLESFNTDPDHPVLIVLHHDGDNYGGGSEGYYNGNFQAFVDWAKSQPDRFVPTTIQDYLDLFPPATDDVIHVESGSWAGADNGDPEFKKWLGDPGADGYSPDRNSWGVITAAKNFVDQAEAMDLSGSTQVQAARNRLLNAEASDYWYWDNSIDGIWDTHPTTAANEAIELAQTVIQPDAAESQAPTIFKPQREPYNPGGSEWTIAQTNEFDVWTYVFDVSGLERVQLKYRTVPENDFPYAKTTAFSQISPSDTSWRSLDMTGIYISPKANEDPTYKADEYSATISDAGNEFVEYYVEAEDTYGNISRSLIQYVWVGENTSTGSGGTGGTTAPSELSWSPEYPSEQDSITISISGATQEAMLHWGVNGQGSAWVTPNEVYRPAGTELFGGSGPALETPFVYDETDSTLSVTIGPFNKEEQTVVRINFVIHYADDSWDNNNGNDYVIDFELDGGGDTHSFVMDGSLDDAAVKLSANNGLDLYVGWESPFLYLATESATTGSGDRFIFVSEDVSTSTSAPWAKSGSVAGWGAFLANEQSNNYQSWFDQNGSAESTAGTYLEGVIDLEGEFGSIPETVYLSLAEFGTNDGGSLLSQSPAGNDDGDIDGDEYLAFSYALTNAEEDRFIPEDFRLLQNYPNPFNPSTIISYHLPKNSQVRLTVFDLTGRKVEDLVDTRQSAGVYSVQFEAGSLASGVYFYQISLNGTPVELKKMLLIK